MDRLQRVAPFTEPFVRANTSRLNRRPLIMHTHTLFPLKLPIAANIDPRLPAYYSYKSSGRRYDYVDQKTLPLYPFGYGLSYTTFEIRDCKLVALAG